ncbi:MAG: hypothetical protein AAGI70_13140, partial [Pseudomonadota bacterium]
MTTFDTNAHLIPALKPAYAALEGLAEAGLRVGAGLFLMPHGAQKLFGWFEAIAPEPAEELLRAVGDQEQASTDPQARFGEALQGRIGGFQGGDQMGIG